MEYMQSFVIVLIEVICFFLFQDIFVPTIKKHKTVFYMVWILTVAVITHAMSYIFEDSFILKEIAMIVSLFSSIVILNRKEKKRALLAAVMFVFLLVTVDMITILLDTKVFVIKNSDLELVDMLVILTSKSILLITILCFRKFIARKWNDFQKQANLMRYAIIPFISICLIAVILSNDMGALNAKMRYLMWGCLSITFIANLLLVFFMKSDAEKNQLLFERKSLELVEAGKKREYKAMEEKLDLQKSLNHDFRNHLNCLQALVEHQNYEEAKAYLAQLNHKYSIETEQIDTHNIIINTVLNDYIMRQKKRGQLLRCRSEICLMSL